MMDDLDVYLDVLFDGLDGLVYSPVKTPVKWEADHWFEYPAQRQELVEHIKTAQGEVYISSAVYKEKRAIKGNIKKVQTVWIDLDNDEGIVDFKGLPDPTLIVQSSSSSHIHAYWRVDHLNQTTVENYTRRLAYYLGADNGGWDTTQLLRPPGTFNHKRGLPVLLAHQSSNFYSVDVFDSVPEVARPEFETVAQEQVKPFLEVLTEYHLPGKLIRMVKKESPVEPYRSSFLARLANELAEEGLPHLELVSLLHHVDERIKKYSGRQDQLVRLSQIADYALHKIEAEEAVVVLSAAEIRKRKETLTWIYPGLLHTTGQLVLSSAPGVGKTQLIVQMAYCLEKGIRWLGYEAPDKHNILFMSLEMDFTSLDYILAHHEPEWTVGEPQFKVIDESQTLTKYEDLVDQLKPSVIMIDSLGEIMNEESENPNVEAKRVMRWCKKIRRRYGVAIVLIHHNRKATEGNKKPKGLADLAGSYIFGKDSETVLQVWEDTKGIEISTVKARFGPKISFYVERNQNLWFNRRDSVSDRQQPIASNSKRNEGQQEDSSRHGNQLLQNTSGPVSLRFGGKDRT